MNVIINGKQQAVEEEMSLILLLNTRGIDPNTVVVEYNNEIVKNEQWAHIILKENDKLEILRFVGGG